MVNIFSKKCHFCGKKIEGRSFKAKVKVHGYYGLNTRHFCSEGHHEKYQKYMRAYEKKRKIPDGKSCTVCMRGLRRV